ncbi:MAG: ROK family protein [Clostridia bacterium]|nr:ROK family protein [Clostridia bacterium]
MYNLGIDLGGTNIAVGVVNEKYEIIGRGKKKTNAPRPVEEIADDIAAACRMAIEDAGLTLADISSAGIGAPGSIDPVNGVIATSNNLRFSNAPMVALVSERLEGIKCYIENDANAAAYGEYMAGAGKGTNDFITITLGTGVGCGIIIGGKLFTGSNYAGGELGHTVMIYGGEQCTCGRKGCWETYASATALIRQTKAAMEKNPDSVMWQLTDGSIDRVSGRTAFDAMRKGDVAGKAVVDQYALYVTCGITNVVNTFQPDVLCIGGGISHEGETLIAPIREDNQKQRYSKNVAKQTEIRAALLGNDAGIIGAACLYNLNN